MARNGFGTDITRRTGSMNKGLLGMTYLKNGGQRVRVIPVNPQTASQQVVRAAFSFLTTAWTQTLSEAERTAWVSAWQSNPYFQTQDTFYGVSRKFGSAKDLFIAMNFNLALAAGNLAGVTVQLLTPGASVGVDTIGITSMVLDASAGTVIFTFTGAFAFENAVIKMTPPLSPGNMQPTSVKSKFRVVDAGGLASPESFGGLYTGMFGAITGQAGQKVFWTIEGVDIATGKSRLIGSGNSVIVP